MTLRFNRVVLVVERLESDTEACVRIAGELAGRSGAALFGLYMEDERILRSAGLPGAIEIRQYTATRAALDQQSLQRHMRAEVAQLRQWLADAQRHAARHFEYHVEVRREPVAQTLRSQLLGDDLVVLNRYALHTGMPLRSRAVEAALGATQACTLMLTAPHGTDTGIGVIVEGDAAGAHRLLEAALALAPHGATDITIFTTAPAGRSPELDRELARRAARGGHAVRFETLDARRPTAMTRRLNRFHGQALVASRTSPLLATAEGCQLLLDLHTTLWLVASGDTTPPG